MIVFRSTNKLLKLSKIKPDSELPLIPNRPLSEWYADVVSLTFPGKSAVIYTNNPSRLTVITVGRSLTTTLDQFQSRSINLLNRLGAPANFIEMQFKASKNFALAKTDSRSVLGSMREIKEIVQYQASKVPSFEKLDIDVIEDILSELLYGWKGSGQKYYKPREYLSEHYFIS